MSPLSRDHVIWAFRLLLDREPESDAVIDAKARGLSTTQALRAEIVTSAEYQEKNRDFAHANERNLVIKELDAGVRLVVDLADHAIGLNILRGRFERSELAFVRSILEPGDHVLDCGAHIGLFAIHMAAWLGPSGTVHAFEPFEDNAACLEQSIRENGFERRVVLERAAVGAAAGVSRLAFAPKALNTGGAFIQSSESALPEGHESQPVNVIALDDLALPRPIRFIKIDVEGAEPLAMRGAARILREDRPVLLSEVHPFQLKRVSHASAADYLDQMRGLGYECRVIGPDGAPADAVHAVKDDDVVSVAFLPRKS
jgi:FkbM family methyltransferase